MDLIPGRKYRLLRSTVGLDTDSIVTLNRIVWDKYAPHPMYSFYETPLTWVINGLNREEDWFQELLELKPGDVLYPKYTILDHLSSVVQSVDNGIIKVSVTTRNNTRLYIGIVSYGELDIWNYYSMWPGAQQSTADSSTNQEGCHRTGHKIVNMSFMQVNMRCKFCDKSEAECEAETRREP